MTTVTITFETSNAAFEDYWAEQVTLLMSRCAGLLRELGNNQSTCTEALLDINGNRMGSLIVTAADTRSEEEKSWDDVNRAFERLGGR
jgi:hypothetical protein